MLDDSHFSGEAAETPEFVLLVLPFVLTATSARRRAGLNHLVAPGDGSGFSRLKGLFDLRSLRRPLKKKTALP